MVFKRLYFLSRLYMKIFKISITFEYRNQMKSYRLKNMPLVFFIFFGNTQHNFNESAYLTIKPYSEVMSYCKKCNLKTKQVSLEGDRKANLPNFGNSLQMWKPFIFISHNVSLTSRIEEEILTEWGVIITPSVKNIGQHFEKTQWKVEIERRSYVRCYLIITSTCAAY